MTRLLRLPALAVAAALAAAPAAAQDTAPAGPLDAEIGRLAEATPADVGELLVELRDNFWKAVFLKKGQAGVDEVLAFRRADIQTGASSGASGTTSAVSSPYLPAIFGVGLEDGAITRSISGTTITLKVDPARLLCATDPARAAAVARRDDDACRTWWTRVGVTAAFDTARGEKKAELADLATARNQFSELTVRVELVNERKATGTAYLGRFATALAAWQARATEFSESDRRTPEIQAAEEDLVNRLKVLLDTSEWKAAAKPKRVQDVTRIVQDVAVRVEVPDAVRSEVIRSWLGALNANRDLEREVANAAVVTAEYALQRPDLTKEAIGTIVPAGGRPPNQHTGRVI
jgi:hypothetical protein